MKPIRELAVMCGIVCITMIQGAQAVVNGIESIGQREPDVDRTFPCEGTL